MTRPDLSHIDTWLFDLDNTLYPEESGFMSSVESRMTDFVVKVTGLERDEAFKLQKTYLAEHGLTLGGLMRHHGVAAEDFHAQFHDLSLDVLAHDAELISALARLPGQRLIFTNADDYHAERVMEHLGLTPLFDKVFHVHSFGFAPKPDPLGFERMIEMHGMDPGRTAFFEDSERNLKPAHDLGMTTVLVGRQAATSTADFVHHRTDRLTPFLSRALLREPV